MEWQSLLGTALGSTPLAAVLGFAVWRLWAKVEAKDAELKALNERFMTILIEVSKLSDDD